MVRVLFRTSIYNLPQNLHPIYKEILWFLGPLKHMIEIMLITNKQKPAS
jgi:hypothetical protein